MYHSFLIHLSADGHLGCFHVLAIVNSAVVSIGVHVSLSTLVSSVCIPSSGIAGSRMFALQNFVAFCHTARISHWYTYVPSLLNLPPVSCPISPRSEWLLAKSLQTINAGEGVEKREPSYMVGGNEN